MGGDNRLRKHAAPDRTPGTLDSGRGIDGAPAGERAAPVQAIRLKWFERLALKLAGDDASAVEARANEAAAKLQNLGLESMIEEIMR